MAADASGLRSAIYLNAGYRAWKYVKSRNFWWLMRFHRAIYGKPMGCWLGLLVTKRPPQVDGRTDGWMDGMDRHHVSHFISSAVLKISWGIKKTSGFTFAPTRSWHEAFRQVLSMALFSQNKNSLLRWQSAVFVVSVLHIFATMQRIIGSSTHLLGRCK
jgi:hypothetical protein